MDWHETAELDRQAFDPAEVFAAGLRLHHIANTAYPIGHGTTMRPYRVPADQIQGLAPLAWQGVVRLGLYVHVPFCQARCAYCEYCVVDPQRNGTDEAPYFDLLLREFELYAEALDTRSTSLIGFDIGGGTPALVEVSYIERVVEAARHHFNLPPSVTISIETTPKIAAERPDKILAYHQMGIGRISMGIQTVNQNLLRQVGRESTSLRANQRAADGIRAAGFQRFNVDVMYGFKGQPLSSLEATLRHVVSLEPEYVTLYRMRYKGTRLASQAQDVSLAEVNAQYALAGDLLRAAGYYATPGKNTFSRRPGDAGTSDYLTERVIHGTPYLGLGLGAQSLSQHTLAYNAGAASKSLLPYRRAVEAGRLPIQDLYHLTRQAAMAKMIAVSFYFGEINRASFAARFGLDLESAFADEVAFVLAQGLMRWDDQTLQLTKTGVEQVNGVIALFYNGLVKAHLLELVRQAGIRE